MGISSMFWFVAAVSVCAGQALNDRPIIGVFAQPTPGVKGQSFIAACFVKFIEQAGARVVPIPYSTTVEAADKLFDGLNGMLFPGGDAEVSDTARYMYSRAIQANERGDVFPVWGTCLGSQWLMIMTGNLTLEDGFDSQNITLPLNLTKDALQSRMFGELDPELQWAIAHKPLTVNLHHEGVNPTRFLENRALNEFFHLLSTNVDRKGRPFVSSFEARKMPIYGVQWHPERAQFEWSTMNGAPYEVTPHTWDAVRLSRDLADLFVGSARMSKHRFPSVDVENTLLIENYPIQNAQPGYMQIYVFTDF